MLEGSGILVFKDGSELRSEAFSGGKVEKGAVGTLFPADGESRIKVPTIFSSFENIASHMNYFILFFKKF